jgi:hypothetical protein
MFFQQIKKGPFPTQSLWDPQPSLADTRQPDLTTKNQSPSSHLFQSTTCTLCISTKHFRNTLTMTRADAENHNEPKHRNLKLATPRNPSTVAIELIIVSLLFDYGAIACHFAFDLASSRSQIGRCQRSGWRRRRVSGGRRRGVRGCPLGC